MRLNVSVTSLLVALLAGVIVWILQPDYRAFSWTQHVEREYLAGFVPGEYTRDPARPPVHTLLDYQAAIDSLHASVPGDYAAYAARGAMGHRLEPADGPSIPIHHGSWVSDGYYEARGVTARFGRLPTGALDEIALGNDLARQMFGDPAEAVGQTVNMVSAFGSQPLSIVGTLQPSPSQDREVDVDEGHIGQLAREVESRPAFMEQEALFLHLRFASQAEFERLEPALAAWVSAYFGEQGSISSRESGMTAARQGELARLRTDVEARRGTLLAFGLLLLASAAGTLVGQLQFHLARRRQLLGVDKALGATRLNLVARLITSLMGWTALGALTGCGALWLLHLFLPDLFLTPPPLIAALTAMLLPMAVLVILALIAALPLVTQSSMALLRGRIKGNRIRALLWLVYGALAFSIAGGLAAMQVFVQVQREADELQSRFGNMYALQAGAAVIDTRLERSFEGGTLGTPRFSEADAAALRALPGVADAVIAQAVPRQQVSSASASGELRAMAAGGPYLGFMDLRLVSGDGSGCVLTEAAASQLAVHLGDQLALSGITGPVGCTLTGIMREPAELWQWLVVDLPDLVTPPLDGIGLALPGYFADPFRSIRILVNATGPGTEQTVNSWLAEAHPGLATEFIPYTPEVGPLLENLVVQAQLFLLISVMAAVLGVWGVVAGFLTLLEADRFRLALDRAFGLSVRRMVLESWQQTITPGVLSLLAGSALGYVIAVRLYNAFALDIPSLPRRELLALNPVLLFSVAMGILLLSVCLTLMAANWLRRQSSLTLLKEGAL